MRRSRDAFCPAKQPPRPASCIQNATSKPPLLFIHESFSSAKGSRGRPYNSHVFGTRSRHTIQSLNLACA